MTSKTVGAIRHWLGFHDWDVDKRTRRCFRCPKRQKQEPDRFWSTGTQGGLESILVTYWCWEDV